LNFENHTVTTDDGYILEMHRVFANLTEELPEDVIRPVFFMQHGLIASSESYLMNGNHSAAFHFARHGYDVWLGNNRVS